MVHQWKTEELSVVCQIDGDLWFSYDAEVQAIAAEACSFCPILEQCRAAGLEYREWHSGKLILRNTHGIWGGLTAVERQKIISDLNKERGTE